LHFVTGGAFNGKSKWVKEYYQLNETPYEWISAYQQKAVPEKLEITEKSDRRLIVLEGIEMWVKEWVETLEVTEIREKWRYLLQKWLEWEHQHSLYQLVLIGTDVSKGIVPIKVNQRKWRDGTGWIYQDTVSASQRVDLVWYGINQQIR
jgi:adenosylcobinamide kinase / adenosylcobinamide-phosphate guanylyltransferase